MILPQETSVPDAIRDHRSFTSRYMVFACCTPFLGILHYSPSAYTHTATVPVRRTPSTPHRMTRSGTQHGALRAHSTATSGYWRRVRSGRARLGTVLLTWWLVAVLVTTPLQCSLHCLLRTGHGAGHQHVAAVVGDGVGTGVAYAGGLCHLAASPPIHALPAAAMQAVPTVLAFLPLAVLLPVLLTLIGAGAARCRVWHTALPNRDPTSIRPLVPPPRFAAC